MAKGPSLLRRIIIRLTVTGLIAIIVAFGWLYIKTVATEAALRNRTLIEQAREVARYLSVKDNGKVTLELPRLFSEAYNQPSSNYRFAILDDSGKPLFSSGQYLAPPPSLREGDSRAYSYDPDGPGPLRVEGAAIRTAVGGRDFVIQVEQTSSERQYLLSSVTAEFLIDGIWLSVPFFLVVLAISLLTVRQAFSPLERLSHLAAEISPGKTDLRLPEIDVPREIMPLVKAVNLALDRLDDGFKRQREFTANAAHQLRTPLAVLAANIDTLSDAAIAVPLRKDSRTP